MTSFWDFYFLLNSFFQGSDLFFFTFFPSNLISLSHLEFHNEIVRERYQKPTRLEVLVFLCEIFRDCFKWKHCLTLSWRRPLSYRNQPIDLRSKSMDWFLYDNGLRHERVNHLQSILTELITLILHFARNLFSVIRLFLNF